MRVRYSECLLRESWRYVTELGQEVYVQFLHVLHYPVSIAGSHLSTMSTSRKVGPSQITYCSLDSQKKPAEFLSLVGKSSHACKVVCTGRVFLRCMIMLASKVQNINRCVRLNLEFQGWPGMVRVAQKTSSSTAWQQVLRGHMQQDRDPYILPQTEHSSFSSLRASLDLVCSRAISTPMPQQSAIGTYQVGSDPLVNSLQLQLALKSLRQKKKKDLPIPGCQSPPTSWTTSDHCWQQTPRSVKTSC